jgi:hypothetical protein
MKTDSHTKPLMLIVGGNVPIAPNREVSIIDKDAALKAIVDYLINNFSAEADDVFGGQEHVSAGCGTSNAARATYNNIEPIRKSTHMGSVNNYSLTPVEGSPGRWELTKDKPRVYEFQRKD